jgi:sulfite exporter TauE/SafE
MSPELNILVITAISISFVHTLTGPDHYLPFIALAKARGWSVRRTVFWTVVCGSGHVWSSVLLGLGGAAIGWSLSKVTWLEEVRGGLAGWTMLLLGLAYSTWGFVRARQNLRHKHFDVEGDGVPVVFEHRHGEAVAPKDRHKVTPWVLFLIFLLGPCEPMIPLLYVPAAANSTSAMLVLVAVYTFFTLVTMVAMVLLGIYGVAFLQPQKLERYMHLLGGVMILICGAGMVFIGW